jgi:hypothetical protein
MGTFDLGNLGEQVILEGLGKVYANPRETPKDIETQMEWADIVIGGNRNIGLPPRKIEVKTEAKYTGNFFFETMSNVALNRAGWAVTTPADTLYYLFWDTAQGYRIEALQSLIWLFDYHKDEFREVTQRKHQQRNETKGHLVPIQWVQGCYVEMTAFDFSESKSRLEKGR